VKMQSSITKHRSQLKLNYTFISWIDLGKFPAE
jgi:hypothetical protein